MKPIWVVITGDRNGYPEKVIEKFLLSLPPYSLVIVGGAKGVDTQAFNLCKLNHINVIVEPAKWDLYGKAAGPIRNGRMLDYQPDLVVAFHKHLEKSKGTADCVHQANQRGIEVRVYT